MMNTKKNIPDHIKIVIKEFVKNNGECHKTYVVYDTRKDGVVCNPRGFITEDDAIKGCLAWLKRNGSKSKRKAENRRKMIERRAEKAKRRAVENSMVMEDEELKETIVTNTKTSQLLCYKELGFGCLCLADSNKIQKVPVGGQGLEKKGMKSLAVWREITQP